MLSSRSGKATVFLIIVIVLAVGLTGYVYYMLQQEKQKSADLDQQLQSLQKKQQTTEQELEESKKKIEDLSKNLADAESTVARMRGDLSKEQKARQEALTLISQLKSDLEKETGIKGSLEKKLSDTESILQEMESRVNEMEAQLKDLEKTKSSLEKKLKSLEEQTKKVELGTIVVGPEGSGSVPAGRKIEGKVLVVNKDYNFAVINVGAKDGVAAGMVFAVLRNNKTIGEIKVEKVHESMAAAGFIDLELKDKVGEGDQVELKG